MSTYLQMGHNSEIFVRENELIGFIGVILSPVNRSESDLKANVQKFKESGITEIIFDPQLYCPQFDRGEMANHSYFPNDMDTADPASEVWWQKIVNNLVVEAKNLDVNAICSPAILPKKYNAQYYAQVADIFSMLVDALEGDAIRPIMTVCISLKELANPDDAFEIASIVSRHNPKSIYLVLESEIEPRREISDSNLLSLMAMIATLEKGGCEIIVSHCSSDMILMKACGASHCATGNFFNLRRFTRSRFDEQVDEGGKQIAYWFEHNLMGFLRRADIARMLKEWPTNFIGGGHSNNAFSQQIFTQFQDEPIKPWVALGWRQYMTWFAATEQELSGPQSITSVKQWLKQSEDRWNLIEDKSVLLDEPRNNGNWLRPWRQIISDFEKLGI